MKKLMFAATAALCATVGFSDVTSANIVGYLNRDGREKCNFYTPCFDLIGNESVTIQDVQLSDDVETLDADLQILDSKRKFIGEMYQWVNAAEVGDYEVVGVRPGYGAWVNGEWALPELEEPLQFGQVVQVTLPVGAGFKANGQVFDDDAVIHGRKDINFVGNPYPTDMSIQNIQLDESVETLDADLQILDEKRKFIGEMYQWVAAAEIGDYEVKGVIEGMGAWVNGEWALPEIPDLKAGEGVQVTLPAAGDITVVAPIEL